MVFAPSWQPANLIAPLATTETSQKIQSDLSQYMIWIQDSQPYTSVQSKLAQRFKRLKIWF